MSYIEGTSVRLRVDFSDPVTRLPVAPGEVVLTIDPPTAAAYTRTLSAGEVLADPERPGRYYYVLAPSEVGTWRYQFEDPTTGQSVLQRKELTVTPRLSA